MAEIDIIIDAAPVSVSVSAAQGPAGAGGGGGASVSDTAYDATSWNGVTTIAPSKNAVRDKFESITPASIGAAPALGADDNYVTDAEKAALHSPATVSGNGISITGQQISLSIGTGSTQVAAGNDSRFTDARTPTAHKTSHATGGSDALTAADIGAQPAGNYATGGGTATGTNTGDQDLSGLCVKANNLSDLADAATARTNLKVPASDVTGITGADAITNIVSLTQAEYNAIGSPSATTLYCITD
jgi:hypothetical protein